MQGPVLYERVATMERELADVKKRFDEKSRGVKMVPTDGCLLSRGTS
jgi:hypothetical protein